MMTSKEIRKTFLEFFRSKQHEIVPSAPIVVKDDPTLMFTNAGMNQFKDIFLGNKKAKSVRVADTQKCLRVSGKHNDLEEVGIDTYHHTMFEMLGNWSFGDYFKKEAIEWAWELLTSVYKIDKDRIYVTVFEGSPEENVPADEEAEQYWGKYMSKDRILRFSKKDNFWEMGDTGPCGPCSEIHVDIRDEAERKKTPGAELVNEGHPQVIEIWNNVFIQYNRKADGSLETLPAKHVDTGMGFERLCMVLQKKQSNYDTDVFQPLLRGITDITGIPYNRSEKENIAMRVIADHIRTVAFTIADGQLPDRGGAGYVIRRILRRAVRYGYSYLNQKESFIYKLLPVLSDSMGEQFPELKAQASLISKVIKEEEDNFLRTLEKGIVRLTSFIEKEKEKKEIPGALAFELFDTYGFPVDLTQLIARENHFTVDMKGYEHHLQEQKTRSQKDAVRETADWVVVHDGGRTNFVGYDELETEVAITRYRKVKQKDKEFYQLVFDKTPFYAESGGQVGDTGLISSNGDSLFITDTKKENDLILHFADKLPAHPENKFNAIVNKEKRLTTLNNHSATHLLHEALRTVLGKHVEQRGSLVNPDYLRFDFSHFQKMTDEELQRVEQMVNDKIQENIALDERRNVPFDEAKKTGAMALFGEKYGDTVRVIRFGTSVELCGGTHVKSTGQIGVFKITSESAVAAGIRRIEALTGPKALEYFNQKIADLKKIEALVKNPDVVAGVEHLTKENQKLSKELDKMQSVISGSIKESLKQSVQHLNGVNYIGSVVNLRSADALKDLSYQLKNDISNLFLVLGTNIDGKPMLAVMIDEQLAKDKNLHAGNIIKELAKEIQGGGGGQPFFATAGGKNAEGLEKAVSKSKQFLQVSAS